MERKKRMIFILIKYFTFYVFFTEAGLEGQQKEFEITEIWDFGRNIVVFRGEKARARLE